MKAMREISYTLGNVYPAMFRYMGGKVNREKFIVENHDVTEDNTRAVDLAPEKPDVLACKMKERVYIHLNFKLC